ncbi:hypothetical protein EDC56_1124 [Sinobacterium caligoides]|uniref:Uncharacterized protein n=1 Tax=Sinobacterium caligoides TaxID=933926 RepID=A0A3N2E0G4_9GAMM|nr:hypothetical protein [Sinobacterium caligoides]ROS05584.1 hypothetical protein EDC56_1124 [Sinobacterium caligoides]
MIKKMILLTGCAMAISTASAGNLLAPGDTISVECTGIKFSLERIGDTYRANLPGKTIEYSELTTDIDSFDFISRDSHGNTLNALMLNYVNDYLMIDNNSGTFKDESGSLNRIRTQDIARSLINAASRSEVIENLKHQGVNTYRSATFNTPLQITITGIEQSLDGIFFYDAKDSTKSRSYQKCYFM